MARLLGYEEMINSFGGCYEESLWFRKGQTIKTAEHYLQEAVWLHDTVLTDMGTCILDEGSFGVYFPASDKEFDERFDDDDPEDEKQLNAGSRYWDKKPTFDEMISTKWNPVPDYPKGVR